MFTAALIFILIGFLILDRWRFCESGTREFGHVSDDCGASVDCRGGFSDVEKGGRRLWKCEKCGSLKLPSWKEDLAGQTVGYLEKEIYCDKCGKKAGIRWCAKGKAEKK